MTKDEALKLALEYIETNAHERRHVRWAIKEALAQPEERYFCQRCGKPVNLTTIHTCTPPVAADNEGFYGFPQGSVSTPNAGGKCVTAGETAPIDPNKWAFDNGLEST